MNEILGLITARGGSKSIHRKNIKNLAGKPLIAWTIEVALQNHGLNRVIVSTEDDEIASESIKWGAEVLYKRPLNLAQDDTPHIDVVLHSIHWLDENELWRPSYIMLLQPTSPLRSVNDIDNAIQIAKSHDSNAVVSVCESEHHPYLTKRIREDNTLENFISSDIEYLRRQVLPPAYVLNGAIYLSKRKSIINNHTFIPEDTHAYIMPQERSLDIDSPWDFYLAELILNNKHDSTNN